MDSKLVTTTALFFDVVDRLEGSRHSESVLIAGFKRSLKAHSAEALLEFQQSFDLALAQARTAELWAAANLLHAPLDPHDFDGFAAWLVCQGSYNFTRALKQPSAAIETLTRAGKRRRRPLFSRLLEVPAELYARRTGGGDLYAALGQLDRGPLPVLASPDQETDETWPHPQALEDQLPVLWQIFAGQDLRIFPLIEDLTDICACCGRVHGYAFGLVSEHGQPLASYTLHWIEGEWHKLQSMIHLVDSNEFFALEHHQEGSESGSSLLDANEAPFTPDIGTLISRSDALNHAQFPLVAEVAQLTLDRDPNAKRFQWFWKRRQQLAPVLEEKLAGLPLARVQSRCTACGEVHEETEIACQVPDELLEMSRWQRRWRVRGDSDELLVDGRRRFRRGLLPVPVKSRNEPYCYGVWVEQLDPAAGKDVLDKNSRQARLKRGLRGLLANDLLFFPEATLGLECRIQPGAVNERPSFQIDEECVGALAREQRKGMPARRPRQLMTLFHG